MINVIRENYLKRIRPFYNLEMIKVITGMRRSGKSVLMNQIIDELKSKGINIENIIYLNLEDFENRDLLLDENLYNYIKNKIVNNDKYYIFIDEIQNVVGFEKVINSLRSTNNCSIFITGSNSTLLSGELSTLLGGRTVSFNLLPFKFSEYVEFNKDNKTSIDDLFLEYLKWGGLPLVCKIDKESKNILIENIYNSIVLKDIITRTNTKNGYSLEKVIDYLVGNSAKSISGTNISRVLTHNNVKVSTPTVYEYINNTVKACIIDKVTRYDIKGKKKLSNEEKIYTKDLGFFNLKKDKGSMEYGALIETVIYNELIARGYKVYVGKTYKSEVDFIAEKNDEKFYIQACYLLNDSKTIEREFSAYKNIKDNYPKYIISLDKILLKRDGIIHLNLIDFLLEN
ncbi:MAG: ATP-binding protein [Pleomorphochaeta sp.]